LPIFRQKRPKRRKDPYPRLGSPEGDALIGPCTGKGCDRQLRRGDIFFTMLSGDLFCIDCYERAGHDLATATPSDPPPNLTFDGDLPF
jgi:hypothetical protein